MDHMKELDFSTLTEVNLVDLNILIDSFKAYVKRELGYDDIEAQIAAEDMENPYDVPYIVQDHIDTVEVAGVRYEVRYCHTDYCACGLFHLADVKPFAFYILFDKSTLKGHSVRAYKKAAKKYIV